MDEKLTHQAIIEHLKKRLSAEYKEIKINNDGNPDLILANHGFKVAYVQVETTSSITPKKAEIWSELIKDGTRLIIIVPKEEKVKTMNILWDKGLTDKVSVGTYEIMIKMP